MKKSQPYQIIIVLQIIIAVSSLQAQNAKPDKYRLSGSLYSVIDTLPIEWAHIINLSQNYGYTSNKDGMFIMDVFKNDTLQFSSVGFSKYTICIDSLILTKKPFAIYLIPDTVEIPQVEVFKLRMEYLKQAILNLPDSAIKDKPIQVPGFKPRNYELPKEPELTIRNPVSLVYSKLNKKGRDSRKMKRWKRKIEGSWIEINKNIPDTLVWDEEQ